MEDSDSVELLGDERSIRLVVDFNLPYEVELAIEVELVESVVDVELIDEVDKLVAWVVLSVELITGTDLLCVSFPLMILDSGSVEDTLTVVCVFEW